MVGSLFGGFADNLKPRKFSLGGSVGPAVSVDPEDLSKTQSALGRLSYPATPSHDPNPDYVSKPFFDGLKAFQKDNGLRVDGIANPGGPTERVLDTRLHEIETPKPAKPAFSVPTILGTDTRVKGRKRPAPLGKNVARQNRAAASTGSVQPAVEALRQGLGMLGYYPTGEDGAPEVDPKRPAEIAPDLLDDPDLVMGLQTFQRHFGLDPDGLVKPGGPTEATLNRLVQPEMDRRGMTALSWLQDAQADDTLAGGSGADTVAGGAGHDMIFDGSDHAVLADDASTVPAVDGQQVAMAPLRKAVDILSLPVEVIRQRTQKPEDDPKRQYNLEEDVAAVQDAFAKAEPVVPTSDKWKPGFNGFDPSTWTAENFPDHLDPRDRHIDGLIVGVDGLPRLHGKHWPPSDRQMRENVPPTADELREKQNKVSLAAADYAVALHKLEQELRDRGVKATFTPGSTSRDYGDHALNRLREERAHPHGKPTSPQAAYETALLDTARAAKGELGALANEVEASYWAFVNVQEKYETAHYRQEIENYRNRE